MSLFAKFNKTNPVDAFINEEYAKRGATAEQDGFDYWKKKIEGGMSLTDVQKGFDQAFKNPELLAERQGITAAQKAAQQKPKLPTIAKPSWKPRNESVMDRVTKYSGSESPLLKAARTRGKQFANSRGLLNSTIAGNAAEAAALDVVVPIASQEASQASQSNLSRQNFEQSSALMQQEHGHRSELQSTELGFKTGQAALDRRMRERLMNLELNSRDKNAASTMLANAHQQYNSLQQSINANKDLDADSRTDQLNSARNWYDSQLKLVEQMYGIDLDW